MLVEPRAMTEDELKKKMASEMAGALGARVPYDMLPEDASQPRLADGSRLTKEVLLDGASAALAAIREAGFEVVPREPTDAMIDAGDAALFNAGDGDLPASYIGPVWKAMLSASPLKGET
jgi:hypothetical protein